MKEQNKEKNRKTDKEEKERKVENMLLGKIYDTVCTPMYEDIRDSAVSEKLRLLMDGMDAEKMDEAQITDKICQGAIIGQKEGFIRGIRFMAEFICEALI